jgi:hypothetical protein
MRRFAVLTCTALAALALPALAGAKEISKVEICGEEDCRTITDAASLRRLVGNGESLSKPAVAPGPYYRVTLTVKHEEGTESWSIFYVPAGDRLALPDGNWEQVTGETAAAYRRETAILEPFPTPTVASVLVNGRKVEDPESYLALYTAGTSNGAVPSSLADWVPVELRFRGKTPWSGDEYLHFSPADGLLQRGVVLVRLPNEMAASIRAGESIAAADGFPWAIVAVLALAVALAAGGLLWLVLRREPALRAPIPT